MVKNRFFKNTLGHFAELIIAGSLDTEETASGATPATASIPVTIGADPTPGDTITITVDGVQYLHTVPVGDETTQQAHDALAALLAANTQGFVLAQHTGTTSSVFLLSWPGADKNGKVVSLAETGSTFTVGSNVTFAGGVNGDAAASDNYEDFVANSNAGTIWAYWEDIDANGKQVALTAGDTKNPANLKRKFFYAWKDANGLTKRTAAIPVENLKYDTVAYNAGQVQIGKVAYGGTINNGQIIHLRVTETSSTQLPYPTYHYDVPFATDIATTVATLAAQLNAETNDKIVTASASGDTITVTGVYKNRTFSLQAYLEVTPAYPNDNSTITFPTSGTQAAKAPVGDAVHVKELEKYQILNSGGINYAPEGTNVDEFQDNSGSNSGATTQWGILLVKSEKSEAGTVRNHFAKGYVVIAVPTGSEATLAAL